MVLGHHGGYDAYDSSDELMRAADEMAREIMRMCDKKQRGHCSAADMSAHLKNTKHKVFLNFMMRKQQQKYHEYDENDDELLDLNDMRNAVRGFFDSDMYGAEMKRRAAHPEDTRPRWKYNSPGAESRYDATKDHDIYAAHKEVNATAHEKRYKQKPTPRKGDFRKTHKSPTSSTSASKTLGKCHTKWLHAKQISFAVNRLGGINKVGPPHFKEAHNVLTAAQTEQARQVFRTWDKDSDGNIAPSELNMAMHAVITSMRQISTQTQGHTAVTIGLDKSQVGAFVEEIFRQADWNHDGALDEEEFVKIYNTIAINCIDYNECIG